MSLRETEEPYLDDSPDGALRPEVARLVRKMDHALLTADEVTALAIRIEAGAYAAHLLTTAPMRIDATVEELEWLVADGEDARRVFIESNLRLVKATARKFRKRGLSDEDVEQDGYHGLVKAVDRFDYQKGFMFSTYAVWWIRESILTGIRSTGFVKQPEVLFNRIAKVKAVSWRLTDELGRPPTVEEIAHATELPVSVVQRCLREDRPVSSLQTPLTADLTLGDILLDPDAGESLQAVEDTFDRRRLVAAVTKIIADLPAHDAVIVKARFGFDGKGARSCTAVAAEIGMSRQHVRLVEQRALAALRNHESAVDLEPYALPLTC